MNLLIHVIGVPRKLLSPCKGEHTSLLAVFFQKKKKKRMDGENNARTVHMGPRNQTQDLLRDGKILG